MRCSTLVCFPAALLQGGELRCCLLLLILPLLFPDRLRAGQEFRVERLTPDDGLSQSIVYDILSDRRGFVWFATRDGLNKYDGIDFRIFRYNPYESNSLSNIAPRILCEDHSGNIWIGHWNSGLDRLDRYSHRITNFQASNNTAGLLSDNNVSALHCDAQGRMWIGTRNGLNCFEPASGKFRHWYFQDSAQTKTGSKILSLSEDLRGNLWAGMEDGRFIRIDSHQGHWEAFNLAERSVYCYGVDKAGNFYLSVVDSVGNSLDEVFQRFHPQNGSTEILKGIERNGQGIRELDIVPLLIEADGGLWFAIWPVLEAHRVEESHGLFYASPGSYLSIAEHGLLHNGLKPIVHANVIVLKRDHAGHLWAGSPTGVYQIIPESSSFATARHNPLDSGSLSHNFIRSILVDSRDELWVGTERGLNRFDRERQCWRRYQIDTSSSCTLTDNCINVIHEDHDSNLLFGTQLGIAAYDRGTDCFETSLASKNSTTDNLYAKVWSLYRERSGLLWVGTGFGGLFVLDRDNKLRHRFTGLDDDSSGLPLAHIWDIHEDRRGWIWIACNEGLYRWLPHSKSFRAYLPDEAEPSSIAGKNVCWLHEDRQGRLWLAIHGAGICRYNPSSDDFRVYSTQDGLPDNAVYGLLDDDNDGLWISSNSGLTRFDPISGDLRTYTSRDGLQSNEFTFKALCKSAAGELLFGGINGLNRFDPASIRINRREPPVVITGVTLLDTVHRYELPAEDTLTFRYNENFVSFEFAALDFTNARRNLYAYRLLGLDSQWTYCGARRYASFTNLDPGAYMFQVKGSNNDAVWNESGVSVHFIIASPYWMTVWFRSLVYSAAISLIALVLLLRSRIERRQTMLKRSAMESQLQALRSQMNPHFIFNALNSMQHLILTSKASLAADYLSNFAKLVRVVLENSFVGRITLQQELEYLRLYLAMESLRFDDSFEYRFEIDPKLDVNTTSLPPMLIQPYVENAIHHSLRHVANGGVLTIGMMRRKATILCSIEDNGLGRARAQALQAADSVKKRSLGMRLTRERLALLQQLYQRRIGVRLIDLLDRDGAPCGTRIELEISLDV